MVRASAVLVGNYSNVLKASPVGVFDTTEYNSAGTGLMMAELMVVMVLIAIVHFASR